jgi:uncharacterized protein with GYD domain
MPKYLVKASYSKAGARGISDAGASARVAAVTRAVEGIGGRVESFHFAFGGADTYVILDLPDNETAAALALAVNGSEGATAETVVLLTPEQMDAAARMNVEFTPAGG